MKVLVTGASGFVGKAVTEHLRRRSDWSVLAGVRSGTSGKDEVVLGDLSSTSIPTLLPQQGVDAIVHCAARAHVMNEAARDPLAEFRRVNLTGTEQLAERAAQCGVGHFVFISSVKVNGDSHASGQPFTADQVPAPQDPYGVSKLEAEQALAALSARTGMDVTVVRPPLIYGPGVKANFLAMMRWLDKGIPLPLGGAINSRSLVGLGNLCDLIDTILVNPRARGETFMASDGQDLSTPQLLRLIGQALSRPARLVSIPPGIARLALGALGHSAYYERLFGSLEVSIEKTRDVLDWHPPHSPADGLKSVADWYLASKR
ncbi:MAG: NAD-dependent epimerase/dehydratase family protein [Devosia sp.]